MTVSAMRLTFEYPALGFGRKGGNELHLRRKRFPSLDYDRGGGIMRQSRDIQSLSSMVSGPAEGGSSAATLQLIAHELKWGSKHGRLKSLTSDDSGSCFNGQD